MKALLKWVNEHKTLVGWVVVFIGGGTKSVGAYSGLDVVTNLGEGMIGFGGGLIVAGQTRSDKDAKG